ncbi:glycoside hydrolase family 2 TIM barrel-domain containing protein [Candidatus Xianfuyuplasma coldseepsis]|uniref:Glycoside hydrolase family 2 catalytic domain-containing protein n=1 Tax=Candidatus Xianfuyuplasma coldseepsis TaxID=2782163 RepID=A0A7L7KRI7_9MOLU|nr:glycoside hydrolase family 2 TIM barrel-domain containing protein [Xianfuyuplasma coldseepsis]QMS85440.1 hypothetical protein G4Z02_06620 [Xianfuyuplasma coldseepsis]
MKKISIIMISMVLIIVLAACKEEGPDDNPVTSCIPGFQVIDGRCVEIEDNEEDPVTCDLGYKAEGDSCIVDENARFRLDGRNFYMDNEPFFIKGICWNPVGIGDVHPAGLDFSGFVDEDADLMQAAGINVVRTYEPIKSTAVLDTLLEHGIYVINTVYPYGGNSVESVVNNMSDVLDHEAIIMWAIGNEWNYNGIYYGLSMNESIERLNDVAARIKEIDSTRPVTTIYGYLPSTSTVNAMPDVDIWGLNIYSGATFGTIFAQWKNISDKPMYIAEYGADAWNANIDAEDETSQAYATTQLTQEIIDNSSEIYPDNTSIGGTIFSFADEWWKDSNGTPDVQDSGGIAPGGGPYPDQTFNEEFWGIVDIYREPRAAYYALQALYVED